MSIPSGVDQKKSKVYIQRNGGEYVQIFPESFTESEIIDGSLWPVSSHALKQYSNSIEERIAPFSGATAAQTGKIGTVPEARPGDRNSFLRGDGKWTAINVTDEKVKVTLNREKRYYLAGTETPDTNTGGLTFDSGVYVTENRGEIHATTFAGNVVGNVTGNLSGIAARAEKDINGNPFATTYVTATQLAECASSEHTHTIADIDALDGYVKGSSTGAISGADTLTQAIGKLEVRLDKSASLNSPAFTGNPTAPDLTSQSLENQIANKKYVDERISSIVNGSGSALEALDTISELANALDNDANFATTMTNKLNTKLDKTSANYVKTVTISDNATGNGQILKIQRGDDTTYTLNIVDTVVQPGTMEPKKASANPTCGASLKYAREDHVHPLQDATVGNSDHAGQADKADKLTTPRKLKTNLGSTAEATFDGSADQLNIPVAGILPVANGGTGASNLNGLVQTGAVNQTIAGTKTFSSTISGSINGNAATATTASKTQGTPAGTSWVAGATEGKALVSATTTGFGAIANAPTKNYRVALSTYPGSNDLVYLYSVSNANVSAGTNTTNKSLSWNAATGELSATSFNGALTGTSTGTTPGDNDNTTKLATTAWVQRYCNTTKKYLTAVTVAKAGSGSSFVKSLSWSDGKLNYTMGSLTVATSGSGNAVTAVSYSNTTDGGKITVTKGTTFLTSHQSLASCVKTSGNQTIGGTKTFSATMKSSAGDVLCGTANSSMVRINSGTTAQNGGHLVLWGSTHSQYPGTFNLSAQTGSRSTARILSGKPNGTLTWKGNSVQVSSDQKLKSTLQSIPDSVLQAWGEVKWGQFQFKDALEEKGSANARLHAGLIAQQVDQVFRRRGLDACKYGVLCYEPDMENENDGLWMIRYQEADAMEAAYLRREIALLKERIAKLEGR